MDIGTGLALFGSAKLAERLLGPTADYLGEGLKTWTQRRAANVKNIFEKAARKLGAAVDQPGFVPPRVLQVVIQQGSFCEDDLSREYFAGVLAASRTTSRDDDRDAVFGALLTRLSKLQIRAHYLLYSTIKELFDGSGYEFNIRDRQKMRIFVPGESFEKAMQIDVLSGDQFLSTLEHVFFGINREDLIGDSFRYGATSYRRSGLSIRREKGIVFQPTVLGAELYLRAHGMSGRPVMHLLLPELKLPSLTESPVLGGSRRRHVPF